MQVYMQVYMQVNTKSIVLKSQQDSNTWLQGIILWRKPVSHVNGEVANQSLI